MSEVKQEDLQAMREWLKKQPHLPSLPDYQLIMFLHSCYYSLERAKQALDVCFTVRTHAPEVFENRAPDSADVQSAVNVIEACTLPHKDDKGNTIIFTRLKDTDPSKFNCDNIIKAALLGLEVLLKQNPTAPGYVFVFDPTGFGLQHISKVTISTIRKFMVYVQEGFPLRMKAVHVLNTNAIIDKVMMLLKPFLDKELASILFFHTPPNDEFYKVYNKEWMPSEYGGKEKTFAELTDDMRQLVLKEGSSYVAEEAKWRVDESKRQGKLKTKVDLFGADGSFKKLSIDFHSKINKTKMSGVKKEDMEALREWLKKQPHLPSLPDDQLVLFLHSCYYSIERAKQALDVCYTVRTHAPEVFSNRDPKLPKVQAAMNVIEACKLPHKDEKGNTVILTRLKDNDPSKFDFDEIVKAALLGLEIIIRDEPTAEGYVFLFDQTGFSLQHIARISVNTIRKFFVYVQEGFPLRMKAVHVINTTSVIDKIMMLIKPFLNKELAAILYFHKADNADFYKVYNKEWMPKDYGGKEKSVAELSGEMRELMTKTGGSYVEAESKWRVDESKRQGKLKTQGDLFGAEGSFKKLSID
ncbi:uncharacterized protein LOC124545744 [Schistocerca americana]|uniref:uncharacterized protein LOC124545744 n=1 Tax=Schistocerca americana TaxID=7009 RepID=UPI001F4F982B|nr:uncharacterized protein LOC124545744 [Schistocerca americana]